MISLVSDCWGTIHASGHYRELTSPNYPHSYPHNLQCNWNIVTSGDYVIELKFLDFQLEEDFPGCYDFMMIYEDDFPVSRLCGNDGRNITFRASKSLRIVFRTDNSKSFRGFKAVYSRGRFDSKSCVSLALFQNLL